MENNLVSIITPAYGTERFIAETIESVIAQTYPHWELLIADDCSPDNLASVVKSYAEKDPRVKYLRMEKNGGPANARNLSLKNAKGKYIAFLDSDDLWHPEKLEKQISFMQKNDYAFTYTSYQRIKMEGEKYPFINHVPEKITYSGLLKNTVISTLTVILDKSKINNIQMTPGWGYDDYVLWLEILKTGIDAHGLNENLALYRVMEQSVSSNKPRALKWVWHIYRKQQKINPVMSLFYITNFSLNAFIKRVEFNK
ncbi:glycosyl transferase [Bacteriovorax stolpii]|uniref:Glycosyl transferase n=1 Tax=Bacteriovorax stolpii TaxID=960 RepID=A0A2K9NMV9_BACTC|nr:glycosyltransferase family 2 protein [Bacteriovorax stolpii]AUN96840.1 glycosyl transferase [Bacteriovorax stolpii]TDP53118.1 teichuronic acid biosynthesis glycosyltransferase TuaG [Bacteriovorax stolpii]